VLAATHQRLFRELVVVLLNREHGSSLPVFRFLQLLLLLVVEALFVRNRGSDLLLRLHELRAHVENDLVQHLLGLLELGDHRVDVRAEEHCYAIENIHG
jgi:hypothetical protein